MSKDNGETLNPTINLNNLKTELINGVHPVMKSNHKIGQLTDQYFTLRTAALAQAELFASAGVDVVQQLALCNAFIAIASEHEVSRDAEQRRAKDATQARMTAIAELTIAKSAIVNLARMSGVSVKPFEMSMKKGAPLATAYMLGAALRDHVHLLKPPSVVESIMCEIERLTHALVAAEEAQNDRLANAVNNTEEKHLARSALYRAMRDLSRLGFALCRHDASARESFALTHLKRKPTTKVTAVSPAFATTTDDTTDDTLTNNTTNSTTNSTTNNTGAPEQVAQEREVAIVN